MDNKYCLVSDSEEIILQEKTFTYWASSDMLKVRSNFSFQKKLKEPIRGKLVIFLIKKFILISAFSLISIGAVATDVSEYNGYVFPYKVAQDQGKEITFKQPSAEITPDGLKYNNFKIKQPKVKKK